MGISKAQRFRETTCWRGRREKEWEMVHLFHPFYTQSANLRGHSWDLGDKEPERLIGDTDGQDYKQEGAETRVQMAKWGTELTT